MDLLDRYLTAAGVPDARRRESDVELLFDLLGGHTPRFPYETLGMALGDAYPLEPVACVERVIAGLAGYCYTQNTAFAWVLRQLGFDATLHLGVVTGRSKPDPGHVTGGHMAVTVRAEGVEWLADAGLGPGPTRPIPLVEGAVTDGVWTHRMEPSPVPGAAWRLVPDPALGSFRCMDLSAEPTPLAAFLPLHEERRHVGTPGAPYFSVQLPAPDRLRSVIGCGYAEATGGKAPALVPLREVGVWVDAVRGLGCTALDGRDPGIVAALHGRLVREYDAFHAA